MRTGVTAVVLAAAVALLVGAPAGASVQQSSFPHLTVKVKGQGHVRSDDEQIDCPNQCEEFGEGSFSTTLHAIPDPGWRFEGWGGACEGRDPQCTVFVDRETKVTATFEPETEQPPIRRIRRTSNPAPSA